MRREGGIEMQETDEKETKPNVAEQLVGQSPGYCSTLEHLSHGFCIGYG